MCEVGCCCSPGGQLKRQGHVCVHACGCACMRACVLVGRDYSQSSQCEKQEMQKKRENITWKTAGNFY